ncbi:54S ribosomal protein L19, mitochondrial-like [Iris pallida]|uniref:Large ribosomal subunit protein uL11m n=1 Tax=Iris pallida TaxID=29817 RepID=A0AAX6G815_IRIPA|nr:54S ribosomal protein L19, mitochondrial-like [Iris pallida]
MGLNLHACLGYFLGYVVCRNGNMSILKETAIRRPISATIKLTVPAGAARPAPPVGPALGQYRLNLMAFCKDFNARTQKYKPDTPMAVTITAFKDNTFEFVVKSPSVTWYLKRAAGIESGSGPPWPRGGIVHHPHSRVRDCKDEAI